EATIRQYAERLSRVCTVIVEDPAILVRVIDIRTPREKLPAAVTLADLPELISTAARLAPEETAFTHGARTVSYRELDQKLAAVAKAMGAAATPETRVNVALAGLVPGVLTALGGAGLAQAMRALLSAAQAVIARSAQVLDSEGNS
ncbi:hypothetical protein, partial [Streptomyces roseolus]|uniref:hypothetical protein n=1 Tax=Streptomyces roseolus TaxID=67358 RepID=UPI00364B1F90